MKKYIFKFVDHERRAVTKISVNVFTNKRNEDHPNPDDLDAHIEHAIKHVKRNHILKRELIRIVGERYFNNASSTNGRFGEYILKKHHHEKESDLVNISNEASQPRFRKVKQFEMHKVKFTRGKKPAEINQVFDYTKNHYVHDFAITGESDQAVQLAELASFTVPINNDARTTNANASATRNQAATNQAVTNQTTSTSGTFNATGGDDDPFMSARQSYASNRGRMNTNNRDYSSGNNNTNNWGNNNNNSTNTGSRSTANANRNANTMSGNTSGNTSMYNGNNRTTLNANSANASWNNVAASNRGSMANTSALNNNNNNNNNQMGGANDSIYQDKYEKYKRKYLELKNKGLSNF
ncbi:hypothetical protein QJ854_gp201 [Moumouvirus goulette]|uniref:Uncharacterized protein n=1 Tax=Moumouvirus goulette TaxID=1247379 RepID=M1PNJ1_9VIRU|nr:hypothetical protein QJ854_gp201 [Moumouvirus goulette]AGF85581.1 hypothetical protein glt_00776 [Moumouvirus goulette]